MNKPRASLPELFEQLQRADELSIEIESHFKELKNRRLIKKEKVNQAIKILDSVLAVAWQSFARRAARSDFPVLIREDQVPKSKFLSNVFSRTSIVELCFGGAK